MMSKGDYSLFRSIFKKYRLLSEIETLSKFADLMAEKGWVYDESLFSHWQKGTRVPKDRKLLLKILELFVQRGGVKTADEAHLFLASAGLGNLTPAELKVLPSTLIKSPFLVPQKRQQILIREQLLHTAGQILENNKILLISGVAGSGKTVMAIELAYRLRHLFPDGVVWFRLNKKNMKNVFYSLAQLYNFRLDYVYDKHTLASLSRSFLHSKRILYIFDNAEHTPDIQYLLPSSSVSSVIITSQVSTYSFLHRDQTLKLPPFTKEECKKIFQMILDNQFMNEHGQELDEIAHIHGYLPLAVQIAARQLSFSHYTPTEYIRYISHSSTSLEDFSYEDTSLIKSLDLSFHKLKPPEAEFLKSLVIFSGQDFPLEAIAYILNLSLEQAKKIAIQLTRYSLLEQSAVGRYQLHPVIRSYLLPKFKVKGLYINAANFYVNFIIKARQKNIYHTIEPEAESISGILNFLIKNHYYDLSCSLFEQIGIFLWNTGKWAELHVPTMLKHIAKSNNISTQIRIFSTIISWYYYWSGDIQMSKKYTEKALLLAIKINDLFLISFAKERLGKVLHAFNEFSESENLLKEALIYYKTMNDLPRLGNTYRYLAETYLLQSDLDKASTNLYQALAHFNDATSKEHLFYKTIITSYIYSGLGIIAFLKKNYNQSQEYLDISLKLQKKSLHLTTYKAWTYYLLGLVNEQLGRIAIASKYIREGDTVLSSFNYLKNLHKTSLQYKILEIQFKESHIFRQSHLITKLISNENVMKIN